MRLSKIFKINKKSSKAQNEYRDYLSARDLNIRLVCHEARLNLAIGLSPILAQLSKDWGVYNASMHKPI